MKQHKDRAQHERIAKAYDRQPTQLDSRKKTSKVKVKLSLCLTN
jgi:hypothetical protein